MEHFIGIFENLEKKNREIHAKTQEYAQNPLKIIKKCSIQAGPSKESTRHCAEIVLLLLLSQI